jgi:hypothetical protein
MKIIPLFEDKEKEKDKWWNENWSALTDWVRDTFDGVEDLLTSKGWSEKEIEIATNGTRKQMAEVIFNVCTIDELNDLIKDNE